MANCPKCGAPVPDNFPFCGQCGARPEWKPDTEMEKQQGRQYLTFTALSRCRHCGGGLPLQGPRRSVRCAACQGENDFGIERIAEILCDTLFAKQRGVGGIGNVTNLFPEEHRCPGCGTPIDIRAIPVGEERVTPCPKCSAPIVSYPPPAWLKHELPGLLLIIGGERDPADVPAEGEGAVPVAVPKAASPVVLACPACKASLKVDSETARTATCQFCNESVYLPDDLWRVLHPVRRAEGWSIVYEGNLERRKDIEKRQREAAERAGEKAKEARQEPPPEEWFGDEMKTDLYGEEVEKQGQGDEGKGRSMLVPLMIIVAVVGIMMAVLVPLFARGCASM
jgi:uncharacterized protein YbaR (Trm112 family)